MKTCTSCKNRKSVDQFSKLSRAADGLQSKCKQCFSDYNKLHYQRNSEKKKAAVMDRYRAIGKEAWYETRRAYYQEYYQKNRVRLLAASAERDRLNPEGRKGRKARHRARTLVAMSKTDRRKSTLRRKAIKNDPCYYCGRYTLEMHDDHYYPLSKGGTDHWFNLVRACSTCNQKKNARLASSL